MLLQRLERAEPFEFEVQPPMTGSCPRVYFDCPLAWHSSTTTSSARESASIKHLLNACNRRKRPSVQCTGSVHARSDLAVGEGDSRRHGPGCVA
eukprot:UN3319